MENIVYTKSYAEPEYNIKEILRYAGVYCHGDVKSEIPELAELVYSCISDLSGRMTYKVCRVEYPIKITDEAIDLGFMQTSSSALRKNLKGCESIILFAATIGIEIDRFIARYSRISPSKALIYQAIGAERIETLCDIFNEEINEQKAAEGHRKHHHLLVKAEGNQLKQREKDRIDRTPALKKAFEKH